MKEGGVKVDMGSLGDSSESLPLLLALSLSFAGRVDLTGTALRCRRPAGAAAAERVAAAAAIVWVERGGTRKDKTGLDGMDGDQRPVLDVRVCEVAVFAAGRIG